MLDLQITLKVILKRDVIELSYIAMINIMITIFNWELDNLFKPIYSNSLVNIFGDADFSYRHNYVRFDYRIYLRDRPLM